MQDSNGASEDIQAVAVVRGANLRVDSRLTAQAAAKPAASEHDLDAAAAIVGSTLLGGAIWFALALWLI